MVTLQIEMDVELYGLCELEKAREAAREVGGEVYTWKTSGRCNWLERGASIVDVCGLIALPRGLPGTIAMPPDPLEDDDRDP